MHRNEMKCFAGRIYLLLMLPFFLLTLACSSVSKPQDNDEDVALDIEWHRDAGNPIIAGSGSIADICDPSVIYDDGVWRLWASSSIGDGKAYVCYSESRDGIVWDDPRLQFSPSETGWDDRKVEVPTVIKDDGEPDPEKRYKMWYGGASSSSPDLVKIGYAYSSDGEAWTRNPCNDGLVIDRGDLNVCSDPIVVKANGAYHCWYNSFSETEANILHIEHARSDDGVIWDSDAGDPALSPSQAWEYGSHLPENSDDVVHPAVLWNDGKGVFMMYYGSFDASGLETYSGLGYAESTDGVKWTKSKSNPVFLPDGSSPGEVNGLSTGPAVIVVDGDHHLFYSSIDERYRRVICHACSRRAED